MSESVFMKPVFVVPDKIEISVSRDGIRYAEEFDIDNEEIREQVFNATELSLKALSYKRDGNRIEVRLPYSKDSIFALFGELSLLAWLDVEDIEKFVKLFKDFKEKYELISTKNIVDDLMRIYECRLDYLKKLKEGDN